MMTNAPSRAGIPLRPSALSSAISQPPRIAQAQQQIGQISSASSVSMAYQTNPSYLHHHNNNELLQPRNSVNNSSSIPISNNSNSSYIVSPRNILNNNINNNNNIATSSLSSNILNSLNSSNQYPQPPPVSTAGTLSSGVNSPPQ